MRPTVSEPSAKARTMPTRNEPPFAPRSHRRKIAPFAPIRTHVALRSHRVAPETGCEFAPFAPGAYRAPVRCECTSSPTVRPTRGRWAI